MSGPDPIRNSKYVRAEYVNPPKEFELFSFDLLPPELRAVIRDAPFDVSAADMVNNRLVMSELERQGDNAATWLKGRLEQVYRERILPSAL